MQMEYSSIDKVLCQEKWKKVWLPREKVYKKSGFSIAHICIICGETVRRGRWSKSGKQKSQ